MDEKLWWEKEDGIHHPFLFFSVSTNPVFHGKQLRELWLIGRLIQPLFLSWPVLRTDQYLYWTWIYLMVTQNQRFLRVMFLQLSSALFGKKPQITQMLAHARAARRTTWAGMCSWLELVALVRRCRLTPTCFASPSDSQAKGLLNLWVAFGASQDLLKARVNSRPSQPLWSCPDRLPSLRFRGFSNPFLKIGVRGGDLRAGAARGGSILFVVTLHENGICESVSAGKSDALPSLSPFRLSVPSRFGSSWCPAAGLTGCIWFMFLRRLCLFFEPRHRQRTERWGKQF